MGDRYMDRFRIRNAWRGVRNRAAAHSMAVVRLQYASMTALADRMPHVHAFPRALGTGMLVHTSELVGDNVWAECGRFIEYYEAVLSRFRDDSTVGRMRRAAHGGSFDFPDWTRGLFELVDALFLATDGAIDPCVGETLGRLGYGPIAVGEDDGWDAHDRCGGACGSRHANWRNDVERHGTTLVTKRALALDFGVCGKGYLVDMLASRLVGEAARLVLDAGGDLRIIQPIVASNGAGASNSAGVSAGQGIAQCPRGSVRSDIAPLTIALEHPFDTSQAVGMAEVRSGSFCASAPSRRHWRNAAGLEAHHLLNALDGRPVRDIAATWVSCPAVQSMPEVPAAVVPAESAGNNAKTVQTQPPFDVDRYPTALADGLATALFTTPASRLNARLRARLGGRFALECATLFADGTAAISDRFPGRFFTRQ